MIFPLFFELYRVDNFIIFQIKSTTDKEESIKDSLKVLEGASGFLRHELAKRMQLRIVPHIHFNYDESITHGNELSALITKAMGMENPENRMSDTRDQNGDDDSNDNNE